MSITHSISKGVVSSNKSPLSGSYSQVGNGETSIDSLLPAASVNTLISVAYGPGGTSAGNLLSIEIIASQNCTIKTNGTGTSEVQTITVTGTPTGGTFALAYAGDITIAIAFNATATTVQTALRALPAIGATGVNCTGGPLPGTPVTATFAGPLANTNVAILTGDSGRSFTGGSTPTVVIAVGTPGAPQDVLTLSANIPVTWDVSGPHAALFAAAVTAWYVTMANAGRLQARILTA